MNVSIDDIVTGLRIARTSRRVVAVDDIPAGWAVFVGRTFSFVLVRRWYFVRVFDIPAQSSARSASQFYQIAILRSSSNTVTVSSCIRLCAELDFCLAVQLYYYSRGRFQRTRCYILVLPDDGPNAQRAIKDGCNPADAISRRFIRNYVILQRADSCFQGTYGQ